jgi:hypothetical protein
LKNNFLLIIILILSVIISSVIFKNNKDQSINWTFPYFSGAANYQNLFDWQISPSDFEIAKKLNYTTYKNYKHKKSKITVQNTVNNYGYVLIVLFARNLFPQLSEINSVILFQVLVHLIISIIIILFILKSSYQKFLFIVLYSSNPLIIHFVTFPFYYFWLFIPSLSLILIIKRKDCVKNTIPIITLFLLLSTLIRPTTILLSLFVYIYAFFTTFEKQSKIIIFLSGFTFLLGLLIIKNKSTTTMPFHTMYVGIGSYPNNFGISSNSDAEGFIYYKKLTGIEISTDAISGNYRIDSIREKYNLLLKARYFEILKKDKFLIFKNGTLNFLQTFSFGYYTRSLLINYISSIIGFIFLIILIIFKKWVFILGISLYSITYILYFPPIPAYNFGVYLILIMAIIDLMTDLINKKVISFNILK